VRGRVRARARTGQRERRGGGRFHRRFLSFPGWAQPAMARS
jgi:hypothetical protein